jgi:ubiquitin C-terminal hydrolase
MFGLKNYGGSCWLNACLQAILRIPDIKQRYDTLEEPLNSVDKSLHKLWKSGGQEGLKELFDSIRETNTSQSGNPAYEMFAGENIGDSNEAFIYFCDKLPFLDSLCRYTFVEKISCPCGFQQERQDSHIQFELYPLEKNLQITTCISNVVKPEILDSWKCDKCSERGKAQKQIIIKSFPQIFTFKLSAGVIFAHTLIINSNKYQLKSIVSFNGGHWWSYTKNESWILFDDTNVRQLRPNENPSSTTIKMLIYYRVNE